MSKTALIKSLLIPVITAAASIIITAAGVLTERHMFTLILGLSFGGILPVMAVMMLKIDLSKYFKAQLIFLALAAVSYVFLFTQFIIFLVILIGLLGNIAYFILPGALFIAEAIYALIKGENFETKACLIMSSPVLAVLGLLLDYYSSQGYFNR